MNSVQERVRHWREEVRGLSLREFREALNAQLQAVDRISLGTVSNYEKPSTEGRRRAGPKPEVLAAMKRAFPELRLEWLLLGQGEPTGVEERVSAGRSLEEAAAGATGGGDSLAARVLERFPDLELLPPEASALFTGLLARYAMGEPEMELDEDQLMELAADLRWLLFLPLAQWGFDHQPDYERFSAYCIGMLHALGLALVPPGRGDPISTYADSTVPHLRQTVPVGF